jgi:hypothetical protein
MITDSQYKKAAKTIIEYKKQLLSKIQECDDLLNNGDVKLKDIDLSVRLFNSIMSQLRNIIGLAYGDYKTLWNSKVSILGELNYSKLCHKRGFGEKTRIELLTIINKYGVIIKGLNELGPRENIL